MDAGLVMVSLAFHLFVVGMVIFTSVLLCQVMSSQKLLYLFKENVLPHIKPHQNDYICKKLTLKKYATTQYAINTSITITILMTLLCHLNSPSRCQNWYPQLARTGMAVFQLPFPIFQANLSSILCTETVETTMPVAVQSYRDVTISLWLYGSK